jgi:hypothetical protein
VINSLYSNSTRSVHSTKSAVSPVVALLKVEAVQHKLSYPEREDVDHALYSVAIPKLSGYSRSSLSAYRQTKDTAQNAHSLYSHTVLTLKQT